MKRVFFWIFIFLLLFYSLAMPDNRAAVQSLAAQTAGSGEKTTKKRNEPDNLYALSACLMDADTGRILFAKNADEERAMASTTKIMTLLLALELGKPEDVVTISENAARQPDVQLNICTGEKYRLEDLLYSLMLESHNDAAVAIAEHIGGSVEGFARLMNEKAEELSLTHTHFVTPNGLDREDAGGKHHTTAAELARLLSYCITDFPQKEEFLTITRTASHSFSDLEGKRHFTCNNHNAFLSMMEGALTGKTGFTGEAGYCYVGALQRDGKTLVVALLGCGWPNNKGYKWKDTRRLMEYGLNNFSLQKLEALPAEGETLAELPVTNGVPKTYGETAVVPVTRKENPNSILYRKKELLLAEDEKLSVKIQLPDSLEAPISAGSVVGKIKYCINADTIAEEELVAVEAVKKLTYFWYLRQLLDRFLL